MDRKLLDSWYVNVISNELEICIVLYYDFIEILFPPKDYENKTWII